MSGRERMPLPARLLLGLIRGTGAEYLRGDLEESWVGGGSRGTRWRWFVDGLLTVVAWWRPSSVRRRSRLSRGIAGAFHRGGWMKDIGRDLRMVVRGLGRRPGFAMLVVATLGLGIGATTTIYSVVDAVVIQALPYEDADALVMVGNLFPGRDWVEGTSLQRIVGVSGPNVRDWRERTRALSSLEAVEFRMNLLPDIGQGPRLVPFGDVTPGFLPVLGARIQVGRAFLPGDGLETGEIPVILSHREWVASAGGDASIIGKPAPGVPGTRVVGVLTSDFVPPEALFGRTSVGHWRPMDIEGARYAARGERRLMVIGRLSAGVTIDGARAELAAIQANVAREHPDGNVYPDGTALSAGLNGLRAQTVGATGRTLAIFFASSILLLLIAAINGANLLLVRGLDREREMAVRLALGASRWRVARTVLTESLVLALTGGLVGALLAAAGVGAFVRLVPPTLPRLSEVALNGRVLLFSAAGSIALGLVAGLLPALRQSSNELASPSKSGSSTQPRAGLRLRMSLVASQLALAVVLGVGATLLFRSFINVATADPGFEADGLTQFTAFTKRPSPQAQATWQVWDELLLGVRAIPGVAAAAASNLPFESPNWAPSIQLREDAPTTHRQAGAGYVVTPDYFDVLAIPLLEGRAFDDRDVPTGTQVVIVNRAFVREFFPADDAVGQPIRVWSDDGSLEQFEIVGVVGNTVQSRVADGLLPALYVPYAQVDWPQVSIVVRSERDAASLANELRAVHHRFNPIVPAPTIQRVTDRVRGTLVEPRFQAVLFAGFAIIAVVLAAIGLYGTLTHSVGRRAREMGIRMAVGADRSRIFSMVMQQGMTVFGTGLVLGLIGAAFVTRFLRSFLFGIGVLDPGTFALTAVLLTGIAALAILRPARRATGVDPARSLRSEG